MRQVKLEHFSFRGTPELHKARAWKDNKTTRRRGRETLNRCNGAQGGKRATSNTQRSTLNGGGSETSAYR